MGTSNPQEQEARAEGRPGWDVGCPGSHRPWASSPQVNHLRCLHEFVESQTTYYAQCYRHMLDLQKQLGRCPPGTLAPVPDRPELRKACATRGGWRAADR